MRKILVLLLFILLLCLTFSGCSDTNVEETTNSTVENITESTVFTTEINNNNISESTVTTETTNKNESELTIATTEAVVITTEQQTQSSTTDNVTTTDVVTTQKNVGNTLISDEDMEKIENSDAEVYFSDNPNNKSIVAISNKYGVKKENLVALIKVNAEFPSSTVLEFSGKIDANGELIMTYEELKNVYEINETNNTIVRASKSGFDNDGVNFVEAKILVTLAKEYFIPELPNLKENKRYPD